MVIYGDGGVVMGMGNMEASWGGYLQGCSTWKNSFNCADFVWFSIFAFYCKIKKSKSNLKKKNLATVVHSL